MSDQEFEVMDELYFLISYEQLENTLPSYKNDLKDILKELWGRGFIKCLEKHSDEEILDAKKLDLNYKEYNYLATKAGLLAHNSK